MAEPAPNWYRDPTSRHEWRYWNGARWTEHVASAGTQRVDPVTAAPLPHTASRTPLGTQSETSATPSVDRHRTPVLGWVGLLLCLMAIVAVTVPGVGYLQARDDGMRLDGSPQHLVVPAHQTYGVYVNDDDNSGYSERCSAVDEGDQREIRMRSPDWSMGSSDTEVLDLVFDTGSCKVSISCSVPGEKVTVRAVAHYAAMLIGVAAAAIFGFLGAGTLIAWAVIRSRVNRPRLTTGTP